MNATLQARADHFTELEKEEAIIERTAELMGDPEFWRDALDGHNSLSAEVEQQLPRLMANLDDACKLETRPEVGHYAVQAILAALHQVQKQALARAKAKAREEIER